MSGESIIDLGSTFDLHSAAINIIKKIVCKYLNCTEAGLAGLNALYIYNGTTIYRVTNNYNKPKKIIL
jgi:hypothetical protein